MIFILIFSFSGKMLYLSPKQKPWRKKASKGSWKYFMKMPEELVASRFWASWSEWNVLCPYRPTQKENEVFFLQTDSESIHFLPEQPGKMPGRSRPFVGAGCPQLGTGIQWAGHSPGWCWAATDPSLQPRATSTMGGQLLCRSNGHL